MRTGRIMLPARPVRAMAPPAAAEQRRIDAAGSLTTAFAKMVHGPDCMEGTPLIGLKPAPD
jgi:hypothetical protein